jgi:hypothetical protein
MNEQEEQVRHWVVEACKHPPGSLARQRYLTKVIRYASRKLWKETTAYYQDALQQTWVYFCQNVCERGTGDRYDPSRSTVATWLNSYLKRRLQDFYIDTQKQQATRASGKRQSSRTGESDVIDPIDNLAAEPDIPPILNDVKTWVETDITGELSNTHIEGYPQVSCQVLMLRRLPPETSWKDLSAEFGLSVSTLSSFYQRQCLTRLRKFGESEGYL